MASAQWQKVACLRNQLQLKTTLLGGQSFRWKQHGDNLDEFIGVFANVVWVLKQSESDLLFRIVGELPYPKEADFAKVRMKVAEPKSSAANKLKGFLYPLNYYKELLSIYFRLDVDLEECYRQWNKCHRHFEDNSDQFYAVRQLNQDPVENLFSFICSQNNNISRISGLVEKICSHYGSKICDYNGIPYYNFPEVHCLAPPKVEAHLRELSFGYRAKYIQKSAEEILAKGGLQWFHSLQQLDYKEAHQELLSLTGIGPKVADCICLMSLDHLQAIPVDTHVFQIAKNYLPHLGKTKNISGRAYVEIGDKFREIYGARAGWAQTVLFCADLKQFKESSAAVPVAKAEDTEGSIVKQLPKAGTKRKR